ncbi:SoxR reducing system RseC family protein [Clostridium sp.]|uniref:SoxR reducing system RseC family protein n=1 Tax=Clostridium sp. TaxID=1506 RepID=UPI0028401FE2|nr:SoxR reducing system RseC family protein [Clostridium sp.]MDR3597335.1 SoxR reducing system RseC family protein [Clostridium sp.]
MKLAIDIINVWKENPRKSLILFSPKRIFLISYLEVLNLELGKGISMKIEPQKENINENNNKSMAGKKNTNMLLAAFMIFIFPITSIFLGVFVGGYIGTYIEVSIIISRIIGGIVGFAVSAVIIKLFDKSAKKDENAEKIHWDDL